jgi:hypothetical protein
MGKKSKAEKAVGGSARRRARRASWSVSQHEEAGRRRPTGARLATGARVSGRWCDCSIEHEQKSGGNRQQRRYCKLLSSETKSIWALAGLYCSGLVNRL